MKSVGLGERAIGAGGRCFTIAEIGGNFENLEQARRLVDHAVEAGCDAVKLQTFRAETLTTRDAMFDMENTGVASQWEHFRRYELSVDDHRAIFDYAAHRGLLAFSTPSHQSDVDMLESLDVPAHKIGSDDLVNLPLLKYAAATLKPVLLSTGMSTMSEVERAVDAVLEEGNDRLVLFHCTTSYPTHPEAVNLLAMVRMQERFGLPVGYSDHTLGIDVCYAAAVLGAPVVEFHFTYDRSLPGPDHVLSKTPEEAAELVRLLGRLPQLIGDGVKRPSAAEMITRRNNRKSIVVTQAIPAGGMLTPQNMDIKRPGHGIPCDQFWSLVGKTVRRDLPADCVLTWADIG